MTVTHVGSTVKYAEGWNAIFKSSGKSAASKKAAKPENAATPKKAGKKKSKR